jgi:hypothetical protein
VTRPKIPPLGLKLPEQRTGGQKQRNLLAVSSPHPTPPATRATWLPRPVGLARHEWLARRVALAILAPPSSSSCSCAPLLVILTALVSLHATGPVTSRTHHLPSFLPFLSLSLSPRAHGARQPDPRVHRRHGRRACHRRGG